MQEVVYLEFNNWFKGRHYPSLEYVEKNLNNFSNNAWCKENRLCVVACYIDLSINWCITAPIEWVKSNIPQVLSDDTYTYQIHRHCFNLETQKDEDRVITYTSKYSDFLRYPNEDGDVEGRDGIPFKQWSNENLGVTWWETNDE